MAFDLTKLVAFDTETHLIEPGILIPKLVCGSTASVVDSRVAGKLLSRRDALSHVGELLAGDAVIVGANIAFDMAVVSKADPALLSLVFKAYEEGRVFDIQIAQALHAIAEGNLFLDPRTGEPFRTKSGRRGRYSLERCVDLVLGRENAKENDRWRLAYALLEDIPMEEWPEDAKQYPIDDAVNTLEVAIAQLKGGGPGCTPGPHRNGEDLVNQVEAAFALHLGAAWGLRSDGNSVETLRERCDDAHKTFVERFKGLGFFRPDGSKDTARVKRAVVAVYGNGSKCLSTDCVGGKTLSPKSGNAVNCKDCSGTGLDISSSPRTPTGGVCADRDSLVESGDPDLEALGESEAEKVRTSIIPFLEQGVERPITLSPNVLVSSGRVSYDGVVMLLPKGVTKGDIASQTRSTFRARQGYVYCSVDYGALELCSFSQVCLWLLGRSQMAETINATSDPGMLHTAFAGRLAGKSTEEMIMALKAGDSNAAAYRQVGKFANFALLGGMGAAKFCLLARKRSSGLTPMPDGSKMPGVRFCVLIGGKDRCGVQKVSTFKGRDIPPTCVACLEIADEQLRPTWLKQWPEVYPYFNWVKSRVGDNGMTADMPCLGTHRVRGGCGFTDGTNNTFQALAADGAKNALRKLTRECYLKDDSPLYGTRPILFLHDEILAEIPERVASEAGQKMAESMVASMREYIPDVWIKAEPALMRRWYKGAEPHYVDGKLVPWDDYQKETA